MEIIVRAIGLLVLTWGSGWLMVSFTSTPDGDANIGAGLLAFAVLALATGIWAVVDRLRDRRTMALLVRWLMVSLILALGSTFIPQMGGSVDWQVWLSDLVMLGPFTMLQVLVPAAIGVGVAALVTRLRRPSSTEEPQS